MQAAASAESVTQALDVCARAGETVGLLPYPDAIVLVTLSSACLSSRDVATSFLRAIADVCSHDSTNRVTCGAAGAVPAVLAAMEAHGATHSPTALWGFQALSMLALFNPRNADEILRSEHALDVIAGVIDAFADEYGVQVAAHPSVVCVARSASPAVVDKMLKSTAFARINAAGKRNRPKFDYRRCDWAIQEMTTEVLDSLDHLELHEADGHAQIQHLMTEDEINAELDALLVGLDDDGGVAGHT